MRVAAVLLLLGLLVAGCGSSPKPEGFVTVRAVQGAAEDAARAWASDARLVLATALEPSTGDALGTMQDWRRHWSRDDPSVGDGLAQAWLFQFDAPSRPNTGFGFVVSHDGAILESIDDPVGLGFGDANAQPLGNWVLDSDAVATRARDTNATWRDATDRAGMRALFLLEHPANETNPAWFLLLEDEAGGDAVFVAFDAKTGESVDALENFGGSTPAAPATEGGSEPGQLNAVDTEASHQAAIAIEGHGRLDVTLVIDAPNPTSEVNLSVSGPGGVQAALTWKADDASTDADPSELRFERPATGTWTITLRLTGGVLQDYAVRWCAHGSAAEPPQPDEDGNCPTTIDGGAGPKRPKGPGDFSRTPKSL